MATIYAKCHVLLDGSISPDHATVVVDGDRGDSSRVPDRYPGSLLGTWKHVDQKLTHPQARAYIRNHFPSVVWVYTPGGAVAADLQQSPWAPAQEDGDE